MEYFGVPAVSFSFPVFSSVCPCFLFFVFLLFYPLVCVCFPDFILSAAGLDGAGVVGFLWMSCNYVLYYSLLGGFLCLVWVVIGSMILDVL